jgi:hypothetical protein
VRERKERERKERERKERERKERERKERERKREYVGVLWQGLRCFEALTATW